VTDDDISLKQLDLFPTLCQAFGFGVGQRPGFEADDLMAAAAVAEVERGGTCLLLTTDRDAYQLVSERVTILAPRRGARELERIGPPEVVQSLSLNEEQQEKLEAIFRTSSSDLIDLRGAVEKANIALRADLDQPQLDRKSIQREAARLNEARARLFERELMMLVDMRNVLTDQQWSKMRMQLDRFQQQQGQQGQQQQMRPNQQRRRMPN